MGELRALKGVPMKIRLICCAVAAAILLCACQVGKGPETIISDPPAVEPTGQEVLPSDHGGEDTRFPPAPPVCELDFTETESFPFPFEDELWIDYLQYPPKLFLTIEQALYDYDTMWQLLEENFPYFEAIKRELGIDWEAVKAEYRQLLDDRAYDGYISQDDFIQTINSCLREFQSVGHLFLVPVNTRLTLLDLFKDSENAPYQNIVKIVSNPKSQLFYKRMNQLPSWSSSGSNSYSKESDPISIDGLAALSEHLFTGYAEGRVPYLKIESFTQWDDVAQAKLEGFFSSISQKEHLIIDVRGNGGGNDGAWRSGIVPFLAQQEYEFTQFWAAKSGTLNLMLEPEFDKSRGYITRYTDDSWQKEFPYISPDMLTGTDIFLKASSTLSCTDAKDKFHGKIWLLVDEYCYSATDALVWFCKETGFATVVGTKTGGNGKGAQPYMMALPYSGLIVEYEPYLSFNSDGTCNGISGTVPDIVPEEGHDALETCLMLISGKLNY